MLNRRDVCARMTTGLTAGLAAGLTAADWPGRAWAETATLPFYGSLGTSLILYDLDVAKATLLVKNSTRLTANR